MSQNTEPLTKKKWKADDIEDQTGKIFIITGANSGLGFEGAYQLAKHNATVIMACRDLEKGQEAVDEIIEKVPEASLDLLELDLSSFRSIKNFAEQFKEKYDQLHGLLNNAGVMQPPRRETKEGFELQFGVNHLGHFLLTKLLFDVMKETSNSRIVNQSSIAHSAGKIRFDDINWEKDYSRTGAYGQSKLANLLFTYELDKKLKNTEYNIKSIAVHPGYTATDLQHNGPTIGGKSFFSRLYTITNKLIAQDVSMGTLPMLYAATAPDVNSGDYIGPGGFMGIRGHPKRVKSKKHSYNEEDAEKLWEISEEFIEDKFELN